MKYKLLLSILLTLTFLGCKISRNSSKTDSLNRVFASLQSKSTNPRFTVKCKMNNSSGTAAQNWVISLQSSPSSGAVSTALSLRATGSNGTPTLSPSGIHFQDADGVKGKISGYIQLLKASSETDITGYRLYWGKSETEKISQLADFKKTNGDYKYILGRNSSIPQGTSYLLAYSYNNNGENPVPAVKKLIDINIIATSDLNGEYSLPVEIGGKTVYLVIKDGEILGEITFDLSAITSSSQMEGVKEDPSKLNLSINSSSFTATVLDINITSSDNTLTATSTPIHKAEGLSFITDSTGKKTGLYIKKALDESYLSHYVIDFGQNGFRLGIFAAVAKTGSDISYSIPSSASPPVGADSVLLFTKNSAGEMEEGISLALSNITTAPGFTNIYNNGRVETTFLLGTQVAAESVEISIDGGSYQSVTTSGTTWKFSLPVGINRWKDDSKHTLSLRHKGNSLTNTITVFKGKNRDINGDGYPDFAISEPFAGNNGYVHIYHSNGSSLNTTPFTITGTVTDFGTSLAIEDMNGDGYADLVVGSPSDSNGSIYIFTSTGTAGITNSNNSTYFHKITGATTSSMGSSIALADFNGDGYVDIASGNPSYSTSGGTFIYYSSTGSFSSYTTSSNASTSYTGAATSDNLGKSLQAADFNQDGYTDLAISSPGTANGFVNVYNGSASGLSGTVSFTYTSTSSSGFDKAGTSLSSGDYNGDGYPDLAISGNEDNNLYPSVKIFNGSASGLSSPTSITIIGGNYSGETASFVTSGDVNGDGYDDMAFGQPFSSGGNGRIQIFLSSGTAGLSSTAYMSIDGQASEQLGSSGILVDYNGDNKRELIVGIPGYNTSAGRAGYTGISSGTVSLSSYLYPPIPTANAKFGYSFSK